jgi:outer membrane protein assembly factor BamB
MSGVGVTEPTGPASWHFFNSKTHTDVVHYDRAWSGSKELEICPSHVTFDIQPWRLTFGSFAGFLWHMDFTFPLASTLFWMMVGLASSMHAEDWPQWRGPERTGHAVRGARVPSTLPSEPKVVWRIGAGEGFASPVVAAGNVFYFDNQNHKETLHSIDARDAHELWRAVVDNTFTDEQGPPGPRCTPVVEGDRVYAQSGVGELQCLSVADGRCLWHVNFTNDFGSAFLGEDSHVPGAAEHGYTAAPVIVDHRLIACVGGTNSAGIVCFEKTTGKILWKSQADRAAYAAPVIATLAGIRQIVCFTVEGLIGLAVDDGALLWRIPLKTSYGRNCTTPVIVGDWVVAGSYRAGLVGVRVSRAITGLKAERLWVNKEAAMNFSSPVAVGKYVYGLGPQRNLVCVELETGKTVWSKEGYFTTSAEVAHAGLLVLGENILVCTDGGNGILIAANPAECRELGRARICGLNWCNPAYAEGRLYIRDGIKSTGELYCVELSP